MASSVSDTVRWPSDSYRGIVRILIEEEPRITIGLLSFLFERATFFNMVQVQPKPHTLLHTSLPDPQRHPAVVTGRHHALWLRVLRGRDTGGDAALPATTQGKRNLDAAHAGRGQEIVCAQATGGAQCACCALRRAHVRQQIRSDALSSPLQPLCAAAQLLFYSGAQGVHQVRALS